MSNAMTLEPQQAKHPSRLHVHVSQHAVDRLIQRFPQFSMLPRPRLKALLHTGAFLGRKLKRVCSKATNDRIYVRVTNLFGTGEDMVLLVCPSTHPTPETPYSVVTVLSYEQYLEFRRSARKGRPLRKTV